MPTPASLIRRFLDIKCLRYGAERYLFRFSGILLLVDYVSAQGKHLLC